MVATMDVSYVQECMLPTKGNAANVVEDRSLWLKGVL